MKDNKNIKVCLVGSSGGHLTHLYMLKPFWKDKNHFWVTFDKEDARSLLEGEKMYPCYYPTNRSLKALIKNTKIAWNVLHKEKPDLIISCGAAVGYKKAIHFVTLRNYCYEDYPDYYGRVVGSVMAFLDINLIKKHMALGEPFVTCSESLTKMYRSKQNMEIPFIRNGVDVSQYTKRNLDEVHDLRKKLNLAQDKLIFVYSGALIDRKNQREAITAFLSMKKSQEAVLLLLGDGKDFETLKKEYGKYSNILFRGKVSNVNEYLHASDVYLATSKSEGLPNGVLEP